MKFKKFLAESLVAEELTDKQKDLVDTWPETRAPVEISKHVIPVGQSRLIIPLADPYDKSTLPHPFIEEHLKKHGYEVEDYTSGKAKDKYGCSVKIGKILQSTNEPVLLKTFNNDPVRTSARLHNNLQVVISRHPYDVAGMSTNRSWTSCMKMASDIYDQTADSSGRYGPGEMAHFLPEDIKHGTHVAYLTQKGDNTIQNPIARIALKPYHEDKSVRVILRPEPKTYGNAPASSFEHTVNDWTQEHFPMKENTFYRRPLGLYNDADPTLNEGPIAADVHTITADHINSLNNDPLSATRDNMRAHSERLRYVAKHGEDWQKDLLVRAKDGSVRAEVAKHGRDYHRDALVFDANPLVRTAVAKSGNLAHQNQLLNDSSRMVMAALAEYGHPQIKAKLGVED